LPDNNAPQNTQQPDSPQESFFVLSPKIELPKGGGAISGIGEKFAANPVTGTGSMSVPIAISPGRAGFGPQLSLSYDSGAGNGVFGFGWDLSMPSITRKTAKGLPKYQDAVDSDTFILSGAEDLVPVLRKNQDGLWEQESLPPRIVNGNTYDIRRFRPRIEGLFARIERWTRRSDGDTHWRSRSRDNILTVYGKNTNSRIADPEEPGRIFSWLICETRDDKGNAVVYEYKPEDGAGVDLSQVHQRNRGGSDSAGRRANRYLKRIKYGNLTPLLIAGRRPGFADDLLNNAKWMFETVFDYGEHDDKAPKPVGNGQWIHRQDPFSTYRAGFEVRTTRLCQRVLMFHHFPGEAGVGDDCLVRSTDFSYSHQQKPQDPRNPIHTFLQGVSQTAYKRAPADGDYIRRSLPPVEFKYSIPEIQNKVEEIDPASLENLPIGVDGSAYRWTDLHGEGIPGILTEQGDGWWYKRNISPARDRSVEFSTLEQVVTRPNMALAAGAQFMDLAGNGQLDLVMLDGPTPGYYEHDKQEDWQSFKPFTSRLNRNFRDPNLKFLDLNGDGHADVLISENDDFVWHASLAEAGFGPARRVAQLLDEEAGPRLIFADGTQSIYTADLCGDGLTDLVRIRNGEVCYWPNLGYGRFAAKITMDNAPHFDHPDQFEQSRLRLADIDGSGTVDIIYLHGDGVRLYFNQSGNSWSAAHLLKVQPRVDEIVSITTADLFGNGTACLVWSSPLPGDAQHRMRYVNLMGGQKPHLLIKTKNNLGAETQMFYVPSTQFYLADKAAGRPWVSKLPFPVHVVAKVVATDDWRGTCFATSYSYHHGYFDGVEREFRGFGRVEQVDVETYGEFAAGNANSPYITIDQTLYQPPIKTVSWFHTGVAVDRQYILSHYQQEYFKPPAGFSENDLPEPKLQQSNLSADEWREAMRACKGLPLRQEVYELDVDALSQGEQKPVRLFSTAYHNCNIQMLQAQADNRHGVFLVTESEAISYQYDLDLMANTATADPRIAQSLNLNIDEFGNVLQSVAVVYPRVGEHVDGSLTANTFPDNSNALIQQVQSDMHLAYNETRFSNDVDDPDGFDNYRLRQPCEVLTYELTGVAAENSHITLEQLQNLRLSKLHQTDGVEPIELAYHQFPNSNDFEKRLVEHVQLLYVQDDPTNSGFLAQPLPLGEQGALGLPFETYKLALTNNLLTAVYGNKLTPEVREELDNPDKSGYLKDNNNQYWIRSGTAGFNADAAEHFLLPERYTDPFGNTTTLDYDLRDLFIQSSTDPVGNRVSVEKFDYRVLAPLEMKDINDNLSEVVYDTLGLPTAVAVKGKGNEADSLLAPGFSEAMLDLDLDTRIAFFTEDFDQVKAQSLLGSATARHVYDFGEQIELNGAISYGHRPASAAAIMRERHVAQLTVNPNGTTEISPLQVAFEYSDGGGNVLVTKSQAEPEVSGDPLRWIANGKTILNNKGKPVKQFEPYFTDSHSFEEPLEVGVTPIMYYDSAGRLTRTESPDGSFSRVEFSPWHVSSFDANDTAFNADPSQQSDWYKRRTEPAHPRFADFNSLGNQRAAELTQIHVNTPTQVFLDSLGRDVISIEHNKFKDAVGNLHDEKYVTFTKLDAEGKPLWIRDSRGNLVMQYISPPKANNASDDAIPANSVPCYDIAGNLLFQHSMDGGDRWMITDAAGQPFIAWDENENDNGDLEQRRYHTTYDALRRPLQQQLRINNDARKVIERFKYGEDAGEIQGDDKIRNLRGQVFQHYDPSGLMCSQRFDFNGNSLEVERQLAVFSTEPLIHWPEAPLQGAFEDAIYTQQTEYDALDRMTRHYNWHHNLMNVAVYEPSYNERGVLKSEDLIINAEKQTTAEGIKPNGGSRTTPIQAIEYDAKGQRQFIKYGNGTVTRYDYDTETFHLKQLHTTKTNTGTPLSTPPSNLSDANALQNLYYTYDPIGNITESHDDAYEPVFFKSQDVKARSRYVYDALYRLIEAQGRESAQASAPTGGKQSKMQEKDFPINSFTATDKTLRNYTQHYLYDPVGNIKQMQHVAGKGSWTRHYEYEADSNRLKKTRLGSDQINAIVYHYDTHGSMLNLNNVADEYKLHWDSNDMIQHINLGGGGDAFYDYGSDKERTRKRIVQDNVIEERIYLGGMEVFKKFDANGVIVEEIETHHLFDGEQRLLMVEDVFKGGSTNLPDNTTLFKYQYSNHLGSVGLELDGEGKIISYEEYHPYGTTAFSASGKGIKATKKRYRYTGMEPDEESGLSYHSARYYLPWLGRWGSVDPIGVEGGINLFGYADGNPMIYYDRDGSNPTEFLPGLVSDYPHLGQAWDSSAASVLGNKYKQGNYEDNLKAFHAEIDSLPSGPKRSKLARSVFNNARRGFYKRVGQLYNNGIKAFGGIDLPDSTIKQMMGKGSVPAKGVQIDHAIDELAKVPKKSVDATNLGLRLGHAGVPGRSHYKATVGRMRLALSRTGVGVQKLTGIAGKTGRLGMGLLKPDILFFVNQFQEILEIGRKNDLKNLNIDLSKERAQLELKKADIFIRTSIALDYLNEKGLTGTEDYEALEFVYSQVSDMETNFRSNKRRRDFFETKTKESEGTAGYYSVFFDDSGYPNQGSLNELRELRQFE
jgi:RHS repeat-associated protein